MGYRWKRDRAREHKTEIAADYDRNKVANLLVASFPEVISTDYRFDMAKGEQIPEVGSVLNVANTGEGISLVAGANMIGGLDQGEAMMAESLRAAIQAGAGLLSVRVVEQDHLLGSVLVRVAETVSPAAGELTRLSA